MTMIALLAGACLLVGVAIGATGIGGVLLVPALCVTAGLDPGAAIAIAMWSYVFTGLVATVIYGRRDQIDWRAAMSIGAASLPAALVGSLAINRMPDDLVSIAVIAMLLNCAFSLLRPGRADGPVFRPSGRPGIRWLLAVGAITGFGSSVTGTGGPVIALPLLHHLGMPLLAAVGISQALQLPIAAAATIGHLSSGGLDLASATPIAAVVSAGVACGALLSPRVPQQSFRLVVGVLALVAAGALALGLDWEEPDRALPGASEIKAVSATARGPWVFAFAPTEQVESGRRHGHLFCGPCQHPDQQPEQRRGESERRPRLIGQASANGLPDPFGAGSSYSNPRGLKRKVWTIHERQPRPRPGRAEPEQRGDHDQRNRLMSARICRIKPQELARSS